jgi:hypothetical protein
VDGGDPPRGPSDRDWADPHRRRLRARRSRGRRPRSARGPRRRRLPGRRRGRLAGARAAAGRPRPLRAPEAARGRGAPARQLLSLPRLARRSAEGGPSGPCLVGGGSEALSAAGDPRRPRGCRARVDDLPRGLQERRGEGARAARQRRAGAHPGRQPSRPRRPHGQGRDARVHASRSRAHEAVQRERRPHGPLPERSPLLRPVRRARPLRGGRGQRGEPRVPGEPLPRSPLRARLPGSRDAHGAARQEPPERDPLVARQRERVRSLSRRHGGLDPPRRPQPPAPLRGSPRVELVPRPRRHRRDLPDVSLGGGDREVGGVGPRRASADHVRVRARHGEQLRES